MGEPFDVVTLHEKLAQSTISEKSSLGTEIQNNLLFLNKFVKSVLSSLDKEVPSQTFLFVLHFGTFFVRIPFLIALHETNFFDKLRKKFNRWKESEKTKLKSILENILELFIDIETSQINSISSENFIYFYQELYKSEYQRFINRRLKYKETIIQKEFEKLFNHAKIAIHNIVEEIMARNHLKKEDALVYYNNLGKIQLSVSNSSSISESSIMKAVEEERENLMNVLNFFLSVHLLEGNQNRKLDVNPSVSLSAEISKTQSSRDLEQEELILKNKIRKMFNVKEKVEQSSIISFSNPQKDIQQKEKFRELDLKNKTNTRNSHKKESITWIYLEDDEENCKSMESLKNINFFEKKSNRLEPFEDLDGSPDNEIIWIGNIKKTLLCQSLKSSHGNFSSFNKEIRKNDRLKEKVVVDGELQISEKTHNYENNVPKKKKNEKESQILIHDQLYFSDEPPIKKKAKEVSIAEIPSFIPKTILMHKDLPGKLEDYTAFEHQSHLPFLEDEETEFKNYSFPFQEGHFTQLKRIFCALLNTIGGRVYFGIRDEDKCVVGVKLKTEGNKLRFSESIANCFILITPHISKDQYCVQFLPIYSHQNHKTMTFNDLFIVKVIIKKAISSELFFTNDRLTFYRRNGCNSKMNPYELKLEILKRARFDEKQAISQTLEVNRRFFEFQEQKSSEHIIKQERKKEIGNNLKRKRKFGEMSGEV